MGHTHTNFDHGDGAVIGSPATRGRRRAVSTALVLTMCLLPAVGTANAGAAQKAKATLVSRHAKHKVPRHRKAAPVAMEIVSAPAPARGLAAAKAPVTRPATPLATSGPCADTGLIPTPDTLDRARAATVCLINRARASQGVQPLRVNADLQAAAQGHAGDMVAQDYFSHFGPTGSDPLGRIQASGYALGNAQIIGENVAAGAGTMATPAQTIADWMAQADHRANILDRDFTETGVGVVAALPASAGMGADGATYVECFGSPG